MDSVDTLFKEFSRLSHYPIQHITPMRSVWPIIQKAVYKKGNDIPEDLPCWYSAVPFVCSFGVPKSENLTILDASIASILLKAIDLIMTILTQNNSGSVDQKSMDIIVTTVNAVIEALSLLIDALRPVDLEEGADSDCEKIIKRLKKIHKDPYNEKNNSAIQKELKKIVKHINKSFSSAFNNSITADVLDQFHEMVQCFEALGIFMYQFGQIEHFTFAEGSVIDLARDIFTGVIAKDQNSYNALVEAMKRTQTQLQTQNNMIIDTAFKAFSASLQKLREEIKNSSAVPLASRLNLPEIQAFPTEYADYLTNMIKNALMHVNIDFSIFQQVAQSVYQKTDNPQVQYVCSCINYIPNKALGYIALLSSILPFAYEDRIPHLLTLNQQLSELFNDYHSELVKIASPYVEMLPLAIKNFATAYFEIPHKLCECYRTVVAMKSIEKYVEAYAEDSANFTLYLDTLNRICNAMFYTTASSLRLLAADLSKYAFNFVTQNISISSRTSQAIVDAFTTLQNISNDACDYDEYQPLIDAVATLADLITHVTKQVIGISPITLSGSLVEIGEISQKIEDTFVQFENLREAILPFENIPIVATQTCFTSVIDPMLAQLENLKQIAATKPEYLKQTYSDMRLLLFQLKQMMLTLDIKESSEAVKQIVSAFGLISGTNNPKEVIAESDKLIVQLRELSKKLSSENVDRDIIENVDINNTEDLTSALKKIQNQTTREATIAWITSRQNDYLVNELFAKSPAIVRSFIVERMKPKPAYNNIDIILQLNDEKLMQQIAMIAGSLSTIMSEAGIRQINHFTTELLNAKHASEARNTLQTIRLIIKKSVPFGKKLSALSEELRLTKQEVTKEIEELCKAYGADVPQVNCKDKREKSLDQIALLFASIVAEERNWSKEYIQAMAMRIEQAQDVNEYVHNVLATFICAACNSGCFSNNIITRSYSLMNALMTYNSSPTVSNKKALISEILSLPVEFQKEGEMSMLFTSLITLSLSADTMHFGDVASISHLLNYQNMYIGTYLKDVYEFTQEREKKPEESEEMKTARIMETSRSIIKQIKKFLRSAEKKDAAVVVDKYMNLFANFNELKRLLSDTNDARGGPLAQQVEEVRKLVEAVVSEIINGKRDHTANIVTPLNDLSKVVRQLISNKQDQTSPVVDLLSILAEDIQEIADTIDNDPSEDELNKFPPLKKFSTTEFRIVVHHARAFVIEAKNLVTNILAENHQFSEDEEKDMDRAVSQLRDAAQVIYLLIRSGNNDDQGFKQRVILGSRRFAAALQVLLAQVTFTKFSKDMYSKINEILEAANARIRAVIDYASQYGITKTTAAKKSAIIDDSYEITHEQSIEKMHLLAKIVRIKRELEICINNEKLLSTQ